MPAFETQIAQLEASGGAYNPLLVEALSGLGQAQRRSGLFKSAAATLQRALHIARANDGLHNPAHIPLLESLLEVHEALGDAESVDRDYQQIYWVRRRNIGRDRALLLPVIAEIGLGRLRAYETAPAAAGMNHLVKADALYDIALRILDESPAAPATGDALLYHAAVVNHRLALEIGRSRVGFHDLRAAMIENGREVFEVNEQQARATLFQRSFLKGEWIAKQIVARTEARAGTAPLAHAEALRFLGDYYLSFRRNMDAMQEYRRSQEVIRRHEIGSQMDRLFGEPALVTALTAPGDDADLPLPASSRFVEALVDIDDSGWPRNVRVQRTQPANDAELARRGEHALHALHYRPRFVNGRPAAATDVPARYVFLDP